MPEKTFHFGKHRGVPLSEVPVNYLEWVIQNVNDKSAVKLAQMELDKRGSLLLSGRKGEPSKPIKKQSSKPTVSTFYSWTAPDGSIYQIPNDIDMTGRENEVVPF